MYRFASALQTAATQLVLMALLGLVLLSAVVGWPAAALVRRLRGRAAAVLTTRRQVAARILAALVAGLALVFLVGLAVEILQTVEENAYVLAFGVPGEAAWLSTLPWIVAVLTSGVVAVAVTAWRQRWWTRAGRAHYALVAAACTGFVVLVAVWGLV